MKSKRSLYRPLLLFASAVLFVGLVNLPVIASSIRHGGLVLLAQNQHDDGHKHGESTETGDEHAKGHSHEMSEAHGGQVYMTKAHHFEVVFVSDGVRVYPYGGSQQPRSAKALSGTAQVKLKGKKETASVELAAFFPAEEGARSFLFGEWDHSKVTPGDAKLTFVINEPSAKDEAKATFTATFDGPTPDVRYHCPMAEHTPDGMADPGKCPKCGMDMEKRTAESTPTLDTNEEDEPHEHQHDH
jgi:hypothetical protein